jgi:hypothetical protein
MYDRRCVPAFAGLPMNQDFGASVAPTLNNPPRSGRGQLPVLRMWSGATLAHHEIKEIS